jgi:hypothetical protein
LPKAPLAVLMSTFTYLAYANERLAYDALIAQAITAHTPILTEADIEFNKLQEFGLSTYDHHSDGAGNCYSSWRRPILNIRPKHRMSSMGMPWALPADLSLIWWLENSGLDYEILTDHDLHAEGIDALRPYRTVINCTHPEYYSEKMLDATEDYLCGGGRLIYSGGNGYYWVSGLREGEPHCMEVRKLDTGSRAWQADPGEGYLASTGEKSGLWRARSRTTEGRRGWLYVGRYGRKPAVRTHAGFLPPAGGVDVRRHRSAGKDRGFRARPRRRRGASRSIAMIWRWARRRMPCCWPHRMAIRTIIRWCPKRSPMPSRAAAAHRIRRSAPTSLISRRPMTAPAFRSARSPGVRRCLTGMATTMSAGSCGMS